MRRQVLGDNRLMAELRAVRPLLFPGLPSPLLTLIYAQNNPEMAEAASSNPTRFRELLHQLKTMQASARAQQERERELLEADPYDLEAQKKIAEAIRQEQVLENMEQAMETMPESYVSISLSCKAFRSDLLPHSFGSVHMLYVNVRRLFFSCLPVLFGPGR
jgi:hypothetical protein